MLHVFLVCNTFPALTQQHLQYEEPRCGRRGHTAAHRCVASSQPRSLLPPSIFIAALTLPEEFQYEQPYLN